MKHYAGNPAHHLTLCINNPFYDKARTGFDMNDVYSSLFQSRNWQKDKPFNVNVLPPLKTNIEMNQVYNALDIDLSGLSSSEGWGIPAHTATSLGKWSCVLNATAHKDWATEENSILIKPEPQMQEVYDNVFFQKGRQFSQGNVYTVTEQMIEEAFKRAEKKAKIHNGAGRKLAETQTYIKTVDQILEKIST